MANQESTRLGLLEWNDDDGELKVTPCVITGESKLEIDDALCFEVESVNEFGRRDFLAAMDDGHFYLSRRRRVGRGVRGCIERYALPGGQELGRCDLGNIAPKALAVKDGRCYVGSAGEIHCVDLSATDSKPYLVFKSDEEWASKPIDAIVIRDETMAAVDDVIWPKYVFLFRVAENGRLDHRFTVDLPEYPSEYYHEAALSESALVLRSTFRHITGGGNRLVVVSIGAGPPRITSEITEISGLEGYMCSDSWFLAGRYLSDWQGICVLDNRIFIGAAERGILICDRNIKQDEKAERFDPGGWCLDLLFRNEQVFTLVKPKGSTKDAVALIHFAWNRAKKCLEIVGKHEVAGQPVRFVR